MRAITCAVDLPPSSCDGPSCDGFSSLLEVVPEEELLQYAVLDPEGNTDQSESPWTNQVEQRLTLHLTTCLIVGKGSIRHLGQDFLLVTFPLQRLMVPISLMVTTSSLGKMMLQRTDRIASSHQRLSWNSYPSFLFMEEDLRKRKKNTANQ